MKNFIALILFFAVLTIFTLSATAVVIPTFEPAQFIYWGSGQIIQTEHNGIIPNAGDWNGDGIKDLLVGTYQNGNIYFYPNSGTNVEPIFATRSLLQAGSSIIALSYG